MHIVLRNTLKLSNQLSGITGKIVSDKHKLCAKLGDSRNTHSIAQMASWNSKGEEGVGLLDWNSEWGVRQVWNSKCNGVSALNFQREFHLKSL